MVAPFLLPYDRDLVDILVVSRIERQVTPVGAPLPSLECIQDEQHFDRAETGDLLGGNSLDVLQFGLAQDAGNVNPEHILALVLNAGRHGPAPRL